MSKYLQHIPKPLLEDFINDNVIPIIGAGFSKNANLPKGVIMPDWKELGKTVASFIDDYEYSNPIDAFSIYEKEYSRAKLIELMSQELHINEVEPSDTYTALCNVFYDTIFTTNFDFLLDDTLRLMKRPTSIIANEEKLSINIKDSTKLVKLHGDFNNPDKMVITEDNYDLFLSNNMLLSTYISNLFITKTMFLVGYSFDDYDIRNIWQIISNRLGNFKRIAYCVLVDASKTEIARFARRNIRVINIQGDKKDYPKILKDFFNEIKEYILSANISKLDSSNARLQEVLKSSEENKNICYVAAPHKILFKIKESMFPELMKDLIIPIILDDVLYPLDNWFAKSEMLIQKSKIALVDITYNNFNVNWEIATLNRYDKPIIYIANKKLMNSSISINDKSFIPYEDLNDMQFLSKLKKALNGHLNHKKISNGHNSKELFDIKDYNNAVMLALTDLENKIRESNIIEYSYDMSFNNLLYQLSNNKKISVDYNRLKEFINLRNILFYDKYIINETEAKEMICLINTIMKDIEKNKR